MVKVHKFCQRFEVRLYSQAHSDGYHFCGNKPPPGKSCDDECSFRWSTVTCGCCLRKRSVAHRASRPKKAAGKEKHGR